MAHPRRKSKRKAEGTRGPNEWHDIAAQIPPSFLVSVLDRALTNEAEDLR